MLSLLLLLLLHIVIVVLLTDYELDFAYMVRLLLNQHGVYSLWHRTTDYNLLVTLTV